MYPAQDCKLVGCLIDDFLAANPVTVAAGETISDIELTLDPRSGFSGRVLDAEDSTPVRDAVVEVYEERYLLQQKQGY